MRVHGRSQGIPGRSRGSMLAGLFIGLVVGVLVAVGIAWYINEMPVPFQERLFGPNAHKQAEPKPAPPASQSAQEPIALPGKPGDKPIEKPRFDFYKILPGGEDAVPAPAGETKPAAAPAQAFLQLGSFQDPADADNLKARLALMGIEASVQQVILPDRGTLHRVRLGPFARPEDMNPVRATLSANGIEASVVKAGN